MTMKAIVRAIADSPSVEYDCEVSVRSLRSRF